VFDSEAAVSGGVQCDAATNTYTYAWKTQKAWAGSCQKVTMTLNNGTTHIALFQLH
jgi:hypothetical protein